MADPLSVGAAVVGVVVPALHGIRLLVEDVERIIDAPKDVKRLEDDLVSLENTLKSIQAIEAREWASLGEAVAKQSEATITTCTAACRTFHEDLQRWTKRSSGGKLSWRARTKIGLFKARQIEAFSKHLQSSKSTCTNLLGVATLYSSIRTTHSADKMSDTISARGSEITALITTTDSRLADVEKALAEMNIANSKNEDDDDDDGDDVESTIAQLEEELAALKSSQSLLPELLSRAQPDEIQKAAGSYQQSTTVTFGDHNSGFQVGVSHGSISNVNTGKAT